MVGPLERNNALNRDENDGDMITWANGDVMDDTLKMITAGDDGMIVMVGNCF